MTADEFWHGDPWLAYSYKKAHALRNQRESEKMWLQGLYNYHAFATALSNLHFDKKNHKVNKYMEEPIRVIPLTEFEKEQKAEQERQKVIAYFNALAKKWGQTVT